jgi:hypothetical protein
VDIIGGRYLAATLAPDAFIAMPPTTGPSPDSAADVIHF